MCLESEKNAAAHIHRQKRDVERIEVAVRERQRERASLMAGVWRRCSENEPGQERRWVETDNRKKEQVGVEKDGLKEGKKDTGEIISERASKNRVRVFIERE